MATAVDDEPSAVDVPPLALGQLITYAYKFNGTRVSLPLPLSGWPDIRVQKTERRC